MGDHDSERFEASAINPELSALLRAAALDERFVSGSGTVLRWADGSEVLDFVAGYGALPLGHNPTAVHEAIAAGLGDGAPCLIQPHYPDAAVALAERLLALLPGEFERVVFSNSGAEAIECALKAARMSNGRHRIVAMERGFHGKTRGAMSVTDMRGRGVWTGRDDGTLYVPFGDADALAALLAKTPDVAAVIVEPVQGEGGVHTAEAAYFSSLRTLCDRHGVHLIFDEVQTGLGRTGSLFATERTGIAPDAIALGKALGGGALPIAAVALSTRMGTETFALQHSSTFAGNKYAALAAHAFLDATEADDFALLRNVRARSAQLLRIHERLSSRFDDVVAEHRGAGLLRGIELRVPERVRSGARGSALAALDRQGRLSLLLAGRLLRAGVRVAPTLRHGATLRVEPPLNVTESECDVYGRAIEEVLTELAHRDSAALAAHIVGPAAGSPPVPLEDATALEEVTPRSGEGRFAFIMHPLTERNLVAFDPALGALSNAQIATLPTAFAGTLDPFRLSRVRVQGTNGASAVGDFIGIFFTAQQLMEMPGEVASAVVQKAVDLALADGAQVIGLGGYTSIVTRGGRLVEATRAQLTTGNSFTVAAAIMAAELAAECLGVRPERKTTAVVGASGSIGSGLIGLSGATARELLLCVNPATPIEKSARRLTRHLSEALEAALKGDLALRAGSVLDELRSRLPGGATSVDCGALAADVVAGRVESAVRVSTDVAKDLPGADLVLVATSSTEAFIHPAMLKPGAVVCDLSRPGNLSYQCRDTRDDVLIIDGGIVAFPGRPELGVRIDMPRGVGFACMAETAMLGLSRHDAGGAGSAIDFREITRLRDLARESGFELADLRAFDRPIGRIDWTRLKALTALETPWQTPPEDAVLRASPDPDSLTSTDQVDFYRAMVARWAEGARADAPALVDADDASLSWSELHRRASIAAVTLADVGVHESGRVLISGRNSVHLVVAIAALWRLGAVPVVADPGHRPRQLREMAATVEATIMIVSDDVASPFAGTGTVLLAETLAAEREPARPPPDSRRRAAAAEAIITFTSGSTGRPKAVAHSIRDLVNTSVNYGRHIVGLGREDRLLTASRLSFTYGFNSLQMAMWHGATSLIAPPHFEAEAVLERIERQRPTLLFGVPTVYMLLLRKAVRHHDLSCLRLCISAGEPLPISVVDSWEARHGQSLVDGLGTSEVISTFISNIPGTLRASHMGRLVPGFELQLRRADGSLVQPGEAGVAWIRGNTVSEGYVGDPETSARFFVDGWYNSNDVLRRDAEGNLHYLGRANDMIKVGGVWLSPARIEAALSAHEAVAECAVVLKEEETPLPRPVAFVCLAPGHAEGANVVEALERHMREALPIGQVAHRIYFLDALPRTVNQKIERFRLATSLEGVRTAAGPVAPSPSVVREALVS